MFYICIIWKLILLLQITSIVLQSMIYIYALDFRPSTHTIIDFQLYQ